MDTRGPLVKGQCVRARLPSQALPGIACGAIVVAALVLQAWPSAQEALVLRRPAIVAGQWWRVVTGHLVHCDWRHLATDVGAFALLCWIGLRRPRTALTVVVLSAVAAGMAVCLWAAGITTYRGISGINYALLAWLLLAQALEERGWRAAAYGAVLVAICGKAVLEMVTGEPVVNVCLPPSVQVVAVAHVAGIVVGVAAAIVPAAASMLRVRSLASGLGPSLPTPGWRLDAESGEAARSRTRTHRRPRRRGGRRGLPCP